MTGHPVALTSGLSAAIFVTIAAMLPAPRAATARRIHRRQPPPPLSREGMARAPLCCRLLPYCSRPAGNAAHRVGTAKALSSPSGHGFRWLQYSSPVPCACGAFVAARQQQHRPCARLLRSIGAYRRRVEQRYDKPAMRCMVLPAAANHPLPASPGSPAVANGGSVVQGATCPTHAPTPRAPSDAFTAQHGGVAFAKRTSLSNRYASAACN